MPLEYRMEALELEQEQLEQLPFRFTFLFCIHPKQDEV